MNRLSINTESLGRASIAELKVILDKLPKADVNVLLSVNLVMNESMSEALYQLASECKITDPREVMARYFINAEDLNLPVAYQEAIDYGIMNEVLVEHKDTLGDITVYILDDSLIKLGILTNKVREVMVVIQSIQLYNEVVNTGRTPDNYIQQLFKYI